MAVLKGLSRENRTCSTFIFRTMLWNAGGFLGRSPKSSFFFRWGHRGRPFFLSKKKKGLPPNLHFEFRDFLREIFNTAFIPQRYFTHSLYGIIDLLYTGSHLIHAVGDNTGKSV